MSEEPKVEKLKVAQRYYDADKNPGGAFLPGVPLRDLSEAEFAALPDWMQRSVDAAPFYRLTKPVPKAPEKESTP